MAPPLAQSSPPGKTREREAYFFVCEMGGESKVVGFKSRDESNEAT